MKIKSLAWYIKEYGEVFGPYIREIDIKENVEVTHDTRKPFDKSTSWAFNEVSGQ